MQNECVNVHEEIGPSVICGVMWRALNKRKWNKGFNLISGNWFKSALNMDRFLIVSVLCARRRHPFL